MENIDSIINRVDTTAAHPLKNALKKVDQNTTAVAQKNLPKQVTFNPTVQHQVTYGKLIGEKYGEAFIRRFFPLRQPIPKPDDKLHCKEGHKKMEAMYNELKLKQKFSEDELDYMEAVEEVMAYFDGASEITLSEKPEKREPQLFTQDTTAHLAKIKDKSTIRAHLNTPSWNDPELDAALSHLLAEALVELNLKQPSEEFRGELILSMLKKRFQPQAPQAAFSQDEFYSLYADLFLRSKTRTGDIKRYLPHTLFNEINESYMKSKLEEKLDIQFLPNSYDVKYAPYPSQSQIIDLVDYLIQHPPE